MRTAIGRKRIDEREYISRVNSVGAGAFEFVGWSGGFNGSKSKAVCRCLIDGNVWSSTIGNITAAGTGCRVCGNASSSSKKLKTKEHYIEKIVESSNGRFSFAGFDGEFVGVKSFAVLVCKCGFSWKSKIGNLISNKTGCPRCARYGYNKNKKGFLYVLRSDCGALVKIGITNNHKKRLSQLRSCTPFGWSTQKIMEFTDGAKAESLERMMLRSLPSVMFDSKFSGHSEWRVWSDSVIKDIENLSGYTIA